MAPANAADLIHTETVYADALPGRQLEHLSLESEVVAFLCAAHDPLSGRADDLYTKIVQFKRLAIYIRSRHVGGRGFLASCVVCRIKVGLNRRVRLCFLSTSAWRTPVILSKTTTGAQIGSYGCRKLSSLPNVLNAGFRQHSTLTLTAGLQDLKPGVLSQSSLGA